MKVAAQPPSEKAGERFGAKVQEIVDRLGLTHIGVEEAPDDGIGLKATNEKWYDLMVIILELVKRSERIS